MSDVITTMVAKRRLERVAVNRDHALSLIATAEQHVRTATLLAGTDDHAMAFTAAYDGTRKALVAVLAVEGLRVRPIGGAHLNTGLAAAALIEHESLPDFDWMRQVRNATEYPDVDGPTATTQDVAEAIQSATDLVAACATYVHASRHTKGAP